MLMEILCIVFVAILLGFGWRMLEDMFNCIGGGKI